MTLDVVTVLIEDKAIIVHEALLSAASPYFRKAFNGSFKEADDRAIFLPDVSERTFRAFLQWLYTQNMQYSTSAAALNASTIDLPDETVKNTAMEAASDEVAAMFDEEDFHDPCDSELHHDDFAFQENSMLLNLNMVQLFVFADKYSIPQLRDDVLTALIGQCWKWGWWPDETETELIHVVDRDLPTFSGFIKFFACSIAWIGFQSPERDAAYKLGELQDLSPKLALQVGITLAEKVQSCNDDLEISVSLSANMPNACCFHDHEVLNQKHCRDRIAAKPYIFTAILQACNPRALTRTGGD